MREERLQAALNSLVPALEGGEWGDVLRRAARVRRVRRRRTALVAAAATLLSLVAALAAGGQIGSLLAHSKEPHLLLRSALRSPDGTHVGSLEIELHGAAVVFGRGVALRRWTPARTGTIDPLSPFAARWFLELDDGALTLAGGTLTVTNASHNASLPLCRHCLASDSGRVRMPVALASMLVKGSGVAVYNGGRRSAVGGVVLQRTRLRRGILCSPEPASCTRIYTGR